MSVVTGDSQCGKSDFIGLQCTANGIPASSVIRVVVHEGFQPGRVVDCYEALGGVAAMALHVDVFPVGADFDKLRTWLHHLLLHNVLLDRESGRLMRLRGKVAHRVYLELPALSELDDDAEDGPRAAWPAEGSMDALSHPWLARIPAASLASNRQLFINPVLHPLRVDANAALVAYYMGMAATTARVRLEDIVDAVPVPSTAEAQRACVQMLDEHLSRLGCPRQVAARRRVIEHAAVQLRHLPRMRREIQRQSAKGVYWGIRAYAMPPQEVQGIVLFAEGVQRLYVDSFWSKCAALCLREAAQLAHSDPRQTVWMAQPRTLVSSTAVLVVDGDADAAGGFPERCMVTSSMPADGCARLVEDILQFVRRIDEQVGLSQQCGQA